MAVTAKSLGIDRLSVAERLDLIGEIWDGLTSGGTEQLPTDSQRDELRRRAADDDASPDDVVSMDVIEAAAKLRHKW